MELSATRTGRRMHMAFPTHDIETESDGWTTGCGIWLDQLWVAAGGLPMCKVCDAGQ